MCFVCVLFVFYLWISLGIALQDETNWLDGRIKLEDAGILTSILNTRQYTFDFLQKFRVKLVMLSLFLSIAYVSVTILH